MEETSLIMFALVLFFTALVLTICYQIVDNYKQEKIILKINNYCENTSPRSCYKYCFNLLEKNNGEDTCLKIYNKYKILQDEN